MRPSRWNWPVPGTRRTRTTASLRRPTVWMGRSITIGSRGAASAGASVSRSPGLGSVSAVSVVSVVVCGLDGLGHWATCLISYGTGF